MVTMLHVVAQEELQCYGGVGEEEEDETVVNGHVCVGCGVDDSMEHRCSIKRSVNQFIRHLHVSHDDCDSIRLAPSIVPVGFKSVLAQTGVDERRVTAQDVRRGEGGIGRGR